MNRVMEPDLRGGEFLDKLQIVENDTATYSAAAKELLGDRMPVSGTLAECHLSKGQWNPSRHHAAHDDSTEIDSTDTGKGKGKQSQGKGKDASGEKGKGQGRQPKGKDRQNVHLLELRETWTQTSGLPVCARCASTSSSCRSCCTLSQMH